MALLTLSCQQIDLSALDLYLKCISNADGTALDCDQLDLSAEDLWKSIIRYDSSAKEFYIAIDLSASMIIPFGGNRWRFFVDAADGYKLKTQKSLDGGTTWITTNEELF